MAREARASLWEGHVACQNEEILLLLQDNPPND